jgi:NAD(P)-dependent dehydrogenase (short-subunit alcohol dehydrogenase family)
MAFHGRLALVTGAASGMGRLSAWRLAAAGATVAAVDVDEHGLAGTARRAPQVHTYRCDVRHPEAVAEVVADVTERHGPIDRVVNAAAIAVAGPLATQPLDEVRRVVEVNYLGLVNVTTAVLPGLLERGRGDLVQFGSLAGWVPSPYFGAYGAAKAAVVSYVEVLAHELEGSGLRIVCACPPMVETPMLEEFRHQGPPGFEKLPGIRPEAVLDAIEAAIEAGRLFTFPGRGTTTVWRLRRFLPEVLWGRIAAMERKGAESAPLPTPSNRRASATDSGNQPRRFG